MGDGALLAPALRSHPRGTSIAVRVQPRARRTELAGLRGPSLRVRLSAPPLDGRANEALLDFLAGLLQVGRSMVSLESGERGRDKVIVVAGMPVNLVRERLEMALSGQGRPPKPTQG